MVQGNVLDDIVEERAQGGSIQNLGCVSSLSPDLQRGCLRVRGWAEGAGTVRISLRYLQRSLCVAEMSREGFNAHGLEWLDIQPVRLWWPHGMGEHPLYELVCEILDDDGRVVDFASRMVGFKRVEWRRMEDAAGQTGPFSCTVNGINAPLFGVRWSDVPQDIFDCIDSGYRKQLTLYKRCNVNSLCVGQNPMGESFYKLCDEMGILVWHAFPPSEKSGNRFSGNFLFAEDAADIGALAIEPIQHHVSLSFWGWEQELFLNDSFRTGASW